MAGLKLKDVNKIYPSGTLALCNVNLELKDNEFIAIVGGEKSGKSTTLRTIAGLEEITEGDILIDDKSVNGVDPKDRDIAMIFQSNTLYPALTAYENMAFGLKLRKASQALIDQRVKSAAQILGLTDVLYRKPKALTAAQKQKVALGRAIVREPRLYLFDDPIAGLDTSLKASMRNVIVNLQARMNGTFIYATKNVSEAVTMATRIVVLRDGFVQQIDTPANLYDYPANAFVAMFMGSPAINFINNAKIVSEDGVVYAVSGDIKLPLADNILNRFTSKDEYINSGKSVILGIRPEDLSQVTEGGNFNGKVTEVEEVAGITYANCDVASNVNMTVKVENVQKGDSVLLAAHLGNMYIFDGHTRLTLLARDGGYEKNDFADADKIPLSFEEEEAIKAKSKQPINEKKKK
jgi:multiple sugar transport system ATP-binding protein